MVNYDLSHLTQEPTQNVWGPIQDDEALFLYSIVRSSRLSRILEIGGLSGYSARNFLQAMSLSKNPVLYTCDLTEVPKLADNHKIIVKNALHLTKEDLDNEELDMVFFDCHDYMQIDIFFKLKEQNLIGENTIIALHDTNLHYAPYHLYGQNIIHHKYLSSEDGYVHQEVERFMVNMFRHQGYDVFSIKTTKNKHDDDFPIRHGITVCRKFKKLL